MITIPLIPLVNPKRAKDTPGFAAAQGYFPMVANTNYM